MRRGKLHRELAAAAFIAAYLGRRARRKRWRNWVKLHITGMGSSYVVLLTAFYVDNGKNLPLWRDLPQIAFWLIPTAVGAPLIVRALWRHPLARAHRRLGRCNPILAGPAALGIGATAAR